MLQVAISKALCLEGEREQKNHNAIFWGVVGSCDCNCWRLLISKLFISVGLGWGFTNSPLRSTEAAGFGALSWNKPLALHFETAKEKPQYPRLCLLSFSCLLLLCCYIKRPWAYILNFSCTLLFLVSKKQNVIFLINERIVFHYVNENFLKKPIFVSFHNL